MPHRNARLTPVTRAELVEQVMDGWPQAEVARLFRVSRSTVSKWVRRFREGGADALHDCSSRPLRSPARPLSSRKQPSALHAVCLPGDRTASGGSWASLAPPSTPYCAAPGFTASRGSIAPHGRSFATSIPVLGALVHLDIKKLGRIPQGGGKRILPGFAETRSGPQRGPRLGFDFVHVAVDDHSRYAYAEALPDERGVSAAAFLVRGACPLRTPRFTVERVLTDNGACYVSRIFTSTAAARNLRLKRTRPFRPQTKGKAEAFNKIMQAEWAYQRSYSSNRERLEALPGFLAYYNHRRPHGGIGGTTPASRL